MAFGYSWDEQQQDPFESSYFQQPSMPAPAPEPAPAQDPFASSVFESPSMSRQAPADDYGSFRSPSGGGLELREPRPSPTQPGAQPQQQQPFDFGSLMSKVRTATDPRSKAIAQDELARTTFQQLKQAGHDVKWQGDQLHVDGRPYVIGDGSAPATPGPNPTGDFVQGERQLPGTPGRTAPAAPQQPTASPYGAAAGSGFGGAGSAQEAYDQISSTLDPNASREEMEAAIEAAFGHLPGYGGAYKESVMLNGRWYDLVNSYGGAGASWAGLRPKGPDKAKMASSMFGNDMLSGLMTPFGGSSSGIGQGRVGGARDVDLSLDTLNPTILALLQQQQEPEQDPLTPSYMGIMR